MVTAQINPPNVVLEPKNRLTIDEYHAIEEIYRRIKFT